MIMPSWSFAIWGLDILGPFPRAIREYWHMYIAISEFTKWSKATLVVKINKQSVVKFIKSIVCRFGVTNRIITDSRSQFTSRVFQEHNEDLGLKKHGAKWIDELPCALRAN
jgi:hypothetical protein